MVDCDLYGERVACHSNLPSPLILQIHMHAESLRARLYSFSCLALAIQRPIASLGNHRHGRNIFCREKSICREASDVAALFIASALEHMGLGYTFYGALYLSPFS